LEVFYLKIAEARTKGAWELYGSFQNSGWESLV